MKWSTKFLKLILVFGVLTGCASPSVITRLTHHQAIEAMRQDESIVLIDVRTASEFAQGTVQGAINVPLQSLEQQIQSVILDKNTTIFVICQTGNRSAEASRILQRLGYSDITDIGGVVNWPEPLVQP